MPLETVVWQGLWGAIAIVIAEVLRDVYHVVSHYWPPLMRLHNWHHRAYKKDFTPVSPTLYRQAQLYNDAPEAIVMAGALAGLAISTGVVGLWIGSLYGLSFLAAAIARSQGWLLTTDLTHEPGELTTIPGNWRVNRTYHWRHHFDDTNAYFAGYLTFLDKLMGTAVSLKGKTVAVTGASGTMGRALLQELARQKARPIALTTSSHAVFEDGIPCWQWQPGSEADLQDALKKVDILIINHGLNVHGDRTPEAIHTSLEANALSGYRLMEVFFSTVETSPQRATKEVWVNTSEAEVSPAFSPLYEVSKRLMGDLVSLRRLDAPCVVRKVILGPFKSNLNPIGVMSADWVAWAVVALAKRNVRNIIVTINPLTYLAFPLKELAQGVYFRLFTRRRGSEGS
ncbi:bifunctional sterol desaturase/short chain dehydrogenase [Nodosilinea sp. LEGE 06152]|uniref:bifunctional sterol desaturase/short chain dehydrogenase n=1 Tax=Nodosilinea sp. LEGE 06152 TaxID=2777966 RepID=UPI001881D15B|nr:bifunctional sterol desaturase/short chain dehydrogenase [Nodosilinea sp. LEGE 06152]MBE9158895.1 bifunctional sterol desaturase/short chain dehydrogenase [Nodosilinea sp. LEGE 06152]